MRQRHTTFYVEAVVLFLTFALVLTLLVQMYGRAGRTSRQADQLTRAVNLAQEGMEAMTASPDPIYIAELLNGEVLDKQVTVIREDLRLCLTLEPRENGLIYGQADVYTGDRCIYTLNSAAPERRDAS